MPTQSLVHLNNNLLCAIDCETTGLSPTYHEIIQIAIVPLDNWLEPRKDVPVFDLKIRPDYLDRIDLKSMEINRVQLESLIESGVSKERSFELFEHYFMTKLKPPEGKKIVPLGYNIAAFDLPFINDWMGNHAFRHYIHGHSRDAMLTACYLNDVADLHAEQVPFPNLKLKFVAKALDIEVIDGITHDALYDSFLAAQVYKKMLTHHLMKGLV